MSRSLDWVWLILCAVLSSVACVTSACDLGVTFDEPIYMEKGLERWRSGTLAPLIKLGTMPLPVDVQTMPVYLWERLRGVAFDPRSDLSTILPVARAANLLFWWVALVYAMLAARSIRGPWAGRLAVLLLACEPNFLGHATLATTDVAVSACLLAFAYHLWTGRDSSWPNRVGIPALWFGLAALSKASGPVFGVLILLAVEGRRRLLGEKSSAFVRDSLQVIALGVLLLFLYCRSDWQPQPDALRWAEKLPEGTTKTVAIGMIKSVRLFPCAADGFFRQVGHNSRGHGAYLLGVTHEHALWWYFPVLLTIKLTVPLLVLTALLLVLARPHLANPATMCALALLLFSVLCRVQIGVRFMLPLIALLIVGVSGAVASVITESRYRYRWGLIAAGCATWAVAGIVFVWPNGLSYINELYGGMAGGYRVASESNYDWGHGVPALRQWAERHAADQPRFREEDGNPLDGPSPRLAVWYYGADPAIGSEPLEKISLHDGDIDANLGKLRGRYLAVSVCLAYGPPLSRPVIETRRRLQELRPVGRTQTFLIYEVP